MRDRINVRPCPFNNDYRYRYTTSVLRSESHVSKTGGEGGEAVACVAAAANSVTIAVDRRRRGGGGWRSFNEIEVSGRVKGLELITGDISPKPPPTPHHHHHRHHSHAAARVYGVFWPTLRYTHELDENNPHSKTQWIPFETREKNTVSS